jgi:RNA polymerase sigma-54 factor
MQSQRPVLRQVQKLKMTPQLYQAVRLMALPIQDLKTTIEEELEKNPALQVDEDNTEVSLDSMPRREKGLDDTDYFDHASDASYSRADGEEASDAKRQFLEGALSQPESLQDHLLWQLALQPITEEERQVGELLIRNLDENGFHLEPLDLLVKEQSATARALVPKLMALIQGLDPLGVCVKDVRESLLVQISRHPAPHPKAAAVVEDHLEALENRKYKEIQKAMRIPEEEVRKILAFIRTLDPLPGRSYSRETPRFVVPDVQIALQDGEFVIILNDEMIPVLGVNPMFEEMAREKAKNMEVRRYVSSNLQNARWFIRSVAQRNETLIKVCRAVVEFQREFFLKGPKYLKPLTLKDVAGEIGVHEATVSRITSSKFVQTEWGIFALKHFFSNSIAGAGSTGSRFSKEGVKEVIREIIQQEGGDKGLSDQKIVEILAGRGIALARRTVAKYRGELDIDSSYQRRRV